MCALSGHFPFWILLSGVNERSADPTHRRTFFFFVRCRRSRAGAQYTPSWPTKRHRREQVPEVDAFKAPSRGPRAAARLTPGSATITPRDGVESPKLAKLQGQVCNLRRGSATPTHPPVLAKRGQTIEPPECQWRAFQAARCYPGGPFHSCG